MNKARARGYNLVELMLALVVLGLLLGSVLVPLQVRYETANLKEAEQAMVDARSAVEGYAIINRTTERQVIAGNDIRYTLPAGRPYLPCPDIDGDGAEDRIVATLASPVIMSSVNIFDRNVNAGNGACREQKGLLPWRTLGLQEQVDPWGRKYGYWVDGTFSNEMVGFDEVFRADIFDPWATGARTAATVLITDTYALRAGGMADAGALVCSRLRKTAGCPDESEQFLLAGIITTVALNIGGVRPVPAYTTFAATLAQGIVDGAAFVIFSHGPNGRGGINIANRCVTVPADTNNLGERANAFYEAGHPFLAAPFNCGAIANAELRENLFVNAPRSDLYSDEAGEGADDIVIWASPNMLVGALLRSGALPVPKLPFLPEER